ncbi:MAG: FxsA family protein [Rhodospirillaceae bacterium]|jgi:UPF0716 protein FxsA|nr:FxsA family protein [Rhodospirillaceae bacterium]
MPLIILIFFIAIPLLEIGVFISISGEIGGFATIGITILTAIVGTFLVRAQGLATLNKVSEGINRGEMPVRPVFDGACQLIAGALLLTPGFITDSIGLVLFAPPFRTLLLAWLISKTSHMGVFHSNSAPQSRYDVDGDYEDITAAYPPVLPDKTKPDD